MSDIWLKNILTNSIGSFSFCCWVLLLCGAFLVYLLPLVNLWICWCPVKKALLRLMTRSLPSMFSSRSLAVSGLTSQVFNSFWVSFVYGIRQGFCFFCVWISSFLNLIYWRGCLFLIVLVYSYRLCHKFIDHICMLLSLGSLFCSINLCLDFFCQYPLV